VGQHGPPLFYLRIASRQRHWSHPHRDPDQHPHLQPLEAHRRRLRPGPFLGFQTKAPQPRMSTDATNQETDWQQAPRGIGEPCGQVTGCFKKVQSFVVISWVKVCSILQAFSSRSAWSRPKVSKNNLSARR
jgi:hypothetical protein